jgi:glutaredoxin
MLAKASHYLKQKLIQQSSPLVAQTRRGIYKAGTEPYVFINEHTKVIC